MAALAVGLLLARSRPFSYDGSIMLQVTESILSNHSLLVHHDSFGLNTPYSSYGIGLSLLMIPAYELGRAIGTDPVSAAMDVNAFLFALTIVAMVVFGRLIALTRRQAMMTAVLVGAGTLLLPYSVLDMSEPGAALAVAVGLVCLECARIGRRWAPAGAGAAAGLAVLFRSDSIILIVPILGVAVWCLSDRRSRAWRGFGLGFAPALGLLAWYNTVRFGAPWHFGYGGQPFNHPFLAGVYGLLLSPGAGLFVFVPLTIVALAGGRWAWQRAPVIAVAAVLLVGARVLFYAPWWGWNGGEAWGPRYLLPALPCLGVGLAEVVRRFGLLGWGRQALTAVIASASIMISVVAATVDVVPTPPPPGPPTGYPTNSLKDMTSPASERYVDSFLFQWRQLPYVYETRVALDGGHLMSKSLAPNVQIPRLLTLLLLTVTGSAVALIGSHDGAPPRTAERAQLPGRRRRGS